MASFLVRAGAATALMLVAAPAMAQTGPAGEQLFQTICAACHMQDAKGATGAATVPALANNPRLTDAAYPITMVLYGRGAMPWFNQMLTPAQIANVVAYVRTHFGNNFLEPVTEADVTALAAKAPNQVVPQQN